MGIIAQREGEWKPLGGATSSVPWYNAPNDPMSLLSAHDLAKSYGARDVFVGVSLEIPYRARIALVGPNGIGKTTLLRLLAGLERADDGHIQRARKLRVGYLPQGLMQFSPATAEPQATLWEFTLTVFSDLQQREKELARLEAEMGDAERAEEALARYGPLQEAFERDGGYSYQAKIRRVLAGLSLSPPLYSRKLESLSGGEYTRAHLARLLLNDPDLLLLDEPTNHLDVKAVEWLEDWLQDWAGGAVIVSHDRYFLDRTVDTVWDLRVGGLETYRGNYSDFLRQSSERRDLQEKLYQAQQEHIRKQEEYIQRNIAGQLSKQAKGRRKRLERLLEQEKVEAARPARKVRIGFGEAERSGEYVLRTENLVVRHPESREALVLVPDLILKRGECAAVIGPNGVGKTTFLRTLRGEEQPLEGEVRLGASLKVGYLDQSLRSLDAQHTVLQTLELAFPEKRPGELRSFLGGFLFSGDDVFKPVEVLSGGEKARLALAKLTMEGANLLLLDEPTTHLDLPSQEILQAALSVFGGTILLVSHDRYLIDALATQVWAISPQSRRLRTFEGGYSQYAKAQREEVARLRTPEAPSGRAKDASRSGESRLRRDLAILEERITGLEAELEELSAQLAGAGSDVEEVRRLGSRFAEAEGELHGLIEEWAGLAKELSRA
jgi:ATP-binding cassette subfamily F protein 3